MRSARRGVWLAAAASIATACGGGRSVTAPVTTPVDSIATFPGFDIAIYPGDAAMTAWRYPASPYRWIGYYLAAPCHRDASYANRYTTLTGMGWGVAALYVGQQDWTQIPSSVAAARAPEATQTLVTCSASLLTAAQGGAEAADAAAKMQADGFPPGSVIFLDVENVQSVTPALLDYYRSWIAGVLRDGRYRPGIYASKGNAPVLYPAATDAVRGAGSTETPAFWIAATGAFSISAAPAAVGLSYARLWQGMFEISQSWNGVTLKIDVDVASTKSPSAP